MDNDTQDLRAQRFQLMIYYATSWIRAAATAYYEDLDEHPHLDMEYNHESRTEAQNDHWEWWIRNMGLEMVRNPLISIYC